MTELIRAQMTTLLVMIGGGMAAALVYDTFHSFILLKKPNKFFKSCLLIFCYLCVGITFSEFLFFCQNGKMTFLATSAFIIGLWLWQRVFCDKIASGEKDEKEKQTPRVRKK